MTGWGLFFVSLGVCTAVSQLFRLVAKIEKSERRR